MSITSASLFEFYICQKYITAMHIGIVVDLRALLMAELRQ